MKTAWIPDLIWLQEVLLPMWSGWESRRTLTEVAGPESRIRGEAEKSLKI